MTREYTNKILEALDEGILDRDTVIMAMLSYMSEDEVKDMAHANEFFPDEEDEDDWEDYDGQPDEAQEWADFDPDC
jgi:hypothetical protein